MKPIISVLFISAAILCASCTGNGGRNSQHTHGGNCSHSQKPHGHTHRQESFNVNSDSVAVKVCGTPDHDCHVCDDHN